MVMTGSPVSSFITGAWNKGIRDFDPQRAYDAMLDAQSVGGQYDKGAFEYDGWSGSGGAHQYLELGYVPSGARRRPAQRRRRPDARVLVPGLDARRFARRLHERGFNLAQTARATASSGTAARAIDGRPMRSGDVEWVSDGEPDPWVQLDWDAPHTLAKVVLSDRASTADNVRAGRLTFSDGSSVDVAGIPADGARRVVRFAPRSASWVRFQATAAEGDAGLNDIEVWDDRDAAAT